MPNKIKSLSQITSWCLPRRLHNPNLLRCWYSAERWPYRPCPQKWCDLYGTRRASQSHSGLRLGLGSRPMGSSSSARGHRGLSRRRILLDRRRGWCRHLFEEGYSQQTEPADSESIVVGWVFLVAPAGCDWPYGMTLGTERGKRADQGG